MILITISLSPYIITHSKSNFVTYVPTLKYWGKYSAVKYKTKILIHRVLSCIGFQKRKNLNDSKSYKIFFQNVVLQ